MRSFDYYKVTTVSQAVALLARHKETAAVLGGGSDMLAIMKDRVEGAKLKSPRHVLDINGVKEMSYIKEEKGSLIIGAATTLSEIASSSLISGKYPLIAQAAGQVGVPQIRNVATLGGNLCQRPRCWYFRGRLFGDCLRKGGSNCYAQAGENQYHAIFANGTCCMVYPSDMAVALAALGAKVEIAAAKGKRMVPVDQFYVKPEKSILKETILLPGELVKGVEVPAPLQGSKGVFLKLKERQAFDFAIVSVAATVVLKGDTVTEAHIVLGGVAPFPWRSTRAEAACKGKKLKDAVGTACKAAVEGAAPLSNNAYKVKATEGLVEQALGLLA